MDGYCLGGLSHDTNSCDRGTSENFRGPNKTHSEASFCDKCAVIRIDDKHWGRGVKKHWKLGPPFVTFPDVLYPHGTHAERIELLYEREDTYPDLPMLEQGSTNGCEFCKLLRESLREYWDLSHSSVGRRIKEQGIVRIRTRKINFLWTTIDPYYPKPCPPEYRRVHLELDYDWISGAGLPSSQSLFFELFSDQGPLAYWLRINRNLRPTSYLHPEVLSQIEKWLDSTSQCVDFSNETQSVPTRLVDVGPSDGTQQPRLIVSEEDLPTSLDGACSYVALSHCWGEPGDLQFKTTNSVLKRFRQEILLESCPETFRDAIKFVRTIGLRYLWIDALCIIQDDQLDWERESVKMYEVYNRAHLTLVPLRSESPKIGFLERDKWPRMNLRFISTLNDGINGSFWLQLAPLSTWSWRNSRSLSDHDQRTSRWLKRAWTLQEMEFSRRLLYFGNNNVSLETHDGHLFNETDENDNVGFTCVTHQKPSVRSCLEANNDIGTAWVDLILSYANRDLTFPRDRLPAISALASLFKSKTEDVYLAGLWLTHLHVHLLWITGGEPKITIANLVQHLRDPVPYIAPSWSWARMKQEVYHLSDSNPETKIQVLEALAEPKGLHAFGAVNYGHLLLRGKIHYLKSYSLVGDNDFMSLYEEDLHARVYIDGALDEEEEFHVNMSKFPFRHRLSTSPILSNMAMFFIAKARGRQVLSGLLLIPKETGLEWLRVGTSDLYEREKFFDSCETVDIKIV